MTPRDAAPPRPPASGEPSRYEQINGVTYERVNGKLVLRASGEPSTERVTVLLHTHPGDSAETILSRLQEQDHD